MTFRATLRRWHIWLGWLVGVPFLFWALSGLIMVWKPIEEVRGTDILAPLPPVVLNVPAVLPSVVAGLPLAKVSLEQRAAGPRWVIEVRGGPTRLADPTTGRLLAPLSAADASAEVLARWRGEATITAVHRTSANDPPLELRRPVASWQVDMSDGTHLFVAADSGAIVATRTRWWRFYDMMWGLHIMDLKGREDTHHPTLVAFAAISLLTVLLALVLLPLSIKRRRS
ncbi:PepSY domain-containing protein [Sphingomonas glaciei]|uniref:PepSY domain-containing protein n=1 Tax=Sphingomonas glaciei TaxID=2938948 RepID=A0ABY5MWH4_9SPHN|nr:PepSY domain-containing protein [Sphingomonas glaciei]UUR07819.1 PepSY domain-containing protein [Sphingomonas glaciei]